MIFILRPKTHSEAEKEDLSGIGFLDSSMSCMTDTTSLCVIMQVPYTEYLSRQGEDELYGDDIKIE